MIIVRFSTHSTLGGCKSRGLEAGQTAVVEEVVEVVVEGGGEKRNKRRWMRVAT
jgi:hypothetical protein